ncbi:MAG: cobalamin adenosyltransferase [Deltaproteobacteria bacterium]|jgi:ethanolamine utilization cobalamin adenosyltransferase|nr:cobalamin adenosyltransferase [Deltaproteobacteria bacterium]
MKALTETELRRLLKDRVVEAWTIPPGTVPTPAALDFLKDRGIKPLYDAPINALKDAFFRPLPPGSYIGPNGEALDHKPEGLTHLSGRSLVNKNHPTIIFRGKLDSLCAEIICAQLKGAELGRDDFVNDLEEILSFVRSLLPAELKGQKVLQFRLLGYEPQTIKDMSHNPVKYFGHRHMKTSWKMGPLSIYLNRLRAQVRETELSAAAALGSPDGEDGRQDIIMALNRLSSLFYVLMFKYLPLGFQPESSGI